MMIAGPAIMCVGCGLLYSVDASDSKSFPMGYSALIGFGCGMVLQNVIIVAQYTFSKEPRYVAVGTGAVTLYVRHPSPLPVLNIELTLI